MRINIIQNHCFQNLLTQQKNKKENVNFKGINKIPFEDRLSSSLKLLHEGDLLVSAKSLETVKEIFKNTIDAFKNIIKRLHFLEESNLDGSIIFFKNNVNELSLLNPNKFDIFCTTFDAKKITMKPQNSYLIFPNDILTVGEKEITIKGNNKTVENKEDLFLKTFDFRDKVEPFIEKQNLKSLKSIFQTKSTKSLNFSDIGGQDKVINELKRGILYPIKYPEAYQNNIINRGFILYGPPGTGKTLIAQALANETDATFIKLNGLELESKWVGQSEENWRNLFEAAKQHQPSIIFIDEFDAVAKKRGGADVYGDKVVNQLLTLMSDIEKNNDEIFVIAATNKINSIDDAIVRSGRFGKHIEVNAPNTPEAVQQILNIHTKNITLSKDISKKDLANKLLIERASGADIAHIVNCANEYAFERAGIYEKMEKGTFTKADIENIYISNEDFENAIHDFCKIKQNSKQRKPIGYTKS